jgi:hypothetical protein
MLFNVVSATAYPRGQSRHWTVPPRSPGAEYLPGGQKPVAQAPRCSNAITATCRCFIHGLMGKTVIFTAEVALARCRAPRRVSKG